MPRSKQFLLEQIARARRFAQAMNTDADRERFEKLAADYQLELDAAEAADDQRSSGTSPNLRITVASPKSPVAGSPV